MIKCEVILKELYVLENGHYDRNKPGSNILVSTWSHRNFSSPELLVSAKVSAKLHDKSALPFDDIPKSVLHKGTTEGRSRIEVVLTNTMKVPKIFKKLLGLASGALDSIPVAGGIAGDLLKAIDDETDKIGTGTLDVKESDFSPAGNEVKIDLKAGEDLHSREKITYSGQRAPSTTRSLEIAKGQPNGYIKVVLKSY